jgi:hypothetical protein
MISTHESYSRIVKDIATSNSTTLAAIRTRANELLTQKDFQLTMRLLDKQLQSIFQLIMRCSIPMPSDIGSPWDKIAQITLLDALGRELPIPLYLARSFDVCLATPFPV